MRLAGYALLALALTACSGKSGDVTVYPLLCSGALKDGDCHGQWVLLTRTVYQVSADNQTVSYRIPGTQAAPMPLAKCKVSDTDNWRCSDADGSNERRMESGEFSVRVGHYRGSDVDQDYAARTRYVSPIRYWYAWFDNWLKPPKEY